MLLITFYVQEDYPTDHLITILLHMHTVFRRLDEAIGSTYVNCRLLLYTVKFRNVFVTQ